MARKMLFVYVMTSVMAAWCASAAAADAAASAPAQDDAAKAQTYEQRLKALEDQIKAFEKRMPAWVENLSFKGDLRYRYEMIDLEDDNKPIQHRNRIRARFGVTAKVTEHADFGFQVAVAGTDPISTNTTLGDTFGRKDLRTDLAYINLHPAFTPNLNIWGGKIPNPFFKPGKSELIWDNDLTPEGGALTYKLPVGDLEVFANIAGFWIVERSSAADHGIDSALFGVQGGAKANLLDKQAYVTAGAGYYDFTNTEGREVFYDAAKPQGNSSRASGGRSYYIYDYNEFEAFAEAGAAIGGVDAVIFGEYVVNTAIGTGDKTGWLAGASLGRLKSQWDWMVKYNYRVIEKDAVIAAFNYSDFKGGGTDGKGHEIGAGLMWWKNIWTDVTYLYNKTPTEHGKDYHRVMVDFNVKF